MHRVESEFETEPDLKARRIALILSPLVVRSQTLVGDSKFRVRLSIAWPIVSHVIDYYLLVLRLFGIWAISNLKHKGVYRNS